MTNYFLPRHRIQIGRAVLDKMQAHEFLEERPVFTDPRELEMYNRIVTACQIIAMVQAGEKMERGWHSRLKSLNVEMEGKEVRRWGFVQSRHMVAAYGHAVNRRLGDTWHWRHPAYVRKEPDVEV